MAVSKRLRYEILRRDSHTCRYCGAKAPDVEITVDHVIPKALGGTDDPSNLVAACRDCNSGKTSAHPDSPLVADVADDALRWSAAVKLAADRMLADHAGRQRAYDQFEEWWAGWNYGFKKLSLPKPDDWRNSIDSFMAAGLPLDVLKWCVNKAGASKAAPDQTWRYMCGIAWKKVTELQQAARSLTQGESDDIEAADTDLMRGRADLARELLADLDDEEIGLLKEEAREDRGAVTEDEQAVWAAHLAWMSARLSSSWFAYSVCELLPAIPGEPMQSALRQARAELYDENGEEFTRAAFAERAVEVATRKYEDEAAVSYLATLSEDERAEWLSYVTALYDGKIGERWALIKSARCAKSINGGSHTWDVMCFGPGEHIKFCPNRATRFIRFNEAECCQEGGDDHDLHQFCDRHFLIAEEGELKRKGQPVTVASWKPIAVEEEEMAVPF